MTPTVCLIEKVKFENSIYLKLSLPNTTLAADTSE